MGPRPERGGVEEDKASQKANSPCKDYVSSYGIKRDQGLGQSWSCVVRKEIVTGRLTRMEGQSEGPGVGGVWRPLPRTLTLTREIDCSEQPQSVSLIEPYCQYLCSKYLLQGCQRELGLNPGILGKGTWNYEEGLRQELEALVCKRC